MARKLKTTTLTDLGAEVVRAADVAGISLVDVARQIGWPDVRIYRFVRAESVKREDVAAVAAVLNLNFLDLVSMDTRGVTR